LLQIGQKYGFFFKRPRKRFALAVASSSTGRGEKRRGGGVRGRIPCNNGRPRPINTPAPWWCLNVAYEKIEGVEPMMGAIIVEVGESQPRTNEHGQEGIVEALRVLRKEVRRARRGRRVTRS